MITSRSNYLEVIKGPMFSGKSTEMRRKHDIFKACGKKVQVFKKVDDKRFKDIKIVTHSGLGFDDLCPVKDVDEIERKLENDTEVLMIDEAQFFPSELYDKIREWINGDPGKNVVGRTVVVTVLCSDAMGDPFPFLDKKKTTGDLLAISDYITECHSKCRFQYKDGTFCHADATQTFRLSDSKDLIDIGGADKYVALCRRHFNEMHLRKKTNKK